MSGAARPGRGVAGVDDGPGTAAAVVRLLADRGETLATVESLTGGLLSAAIVDIPGASSVFRGGLVVYATEMKAVLAGVPETLLARRGPVDPDVALALAEGGRRRCAADWAAATTGVAGPQLQGGKPVGLVYVAVVGPAVGTVRRFQLAGDRPVIRNQAVLGALRLLADELRGGADGVPVGGPA